MGKKSLSDAAPMITCSRVAVFLGIMLFFAGCVSPVRNMDITVNNLDYGGFVQDTVGNFDVYTGNFQVTNPTNSTVENIEVDLTIAPTAAYCHGLTKTFSIPRLVPGEKRTVLVSIAEFGSLDCQYNYTYQVFTQNAV
jgi:hypothetical protein